MQNVKVTKKGRKGAVPARLFILFARSSPMAVIFRRGPSKWVQLVKWNTDTDVFEPGQWFNGRIYERRCDLSPDGSLLIYFAQKISKRSLEDKEYTYAWTAISRPPFLTALVLWPKGDCWHGGGSFKNGRTVLLNHKPDVAIPHPKHKPSRLRVIPNPAAHGEDDPIYSQRLERDGWELRMTWKIERGRSKKIFETTQPEVREKVSPNGLQTIQLTRSIDDLDYAEEFVVRNLSQTSSTAVQGASWVDWDQKGRLVFARDGKILVGSLNDGGHFVEHQLTDLNPFKPSPVPPPEWATKW
jgi:hypothetical protein